MNVESKYTFNYYVRKDYIISEDITWEIDGSQSVEDIIEKFQRFMYSTQGYLGVEIEPEQLEFDFNEN